MAIRLNFIVEGQTEETFVNDTIGPWLAMRAIWASARCVLTRKRHATKYRGGLGKYFQAKRDIATWMKQDRGSDARFTTMFDLYALPADFPGHAEAMQVRDPRDRVRVLENALKKDISDRRFIPYIQLHEFEALLLSDPRKLDSQFSNRDLGIQRLVEMARGFGSPELIDDGGQTAPSKRIINEIPEYAGRKASAGPIVAGHIGLSTLRSKCQHFGRWLGKLEALR